ERLVEREAVGERPRDLVERGQAAGRDRLGLARPLLLRLLPLQVLVERRVLDGDRDLGRQGGEQGRLVASQRATLRRVHGEQPDHLALRDERYRVGGLDRRLLDRRAHRREVAVDGGVGRRDAAARTERPERQLEQAL